MFNLFRMARSKKKDMKSHEKVKVSNTEIERKFLLREFPNNNEFLLEAALIHQAYVSINPEIRIRCKIYEDGTSECTKTIKSNGDLVRTEIEEVISEKEYDSYLREIKLLPIEKEYRKYILEDGTVFEVSRVDNNFYYGEVEFDTEEDAIKWQPTNDIKNNIINEITSNKDYKMVNYWLRVRLGKKG